MTDQGDEPSAVDEPTAVDQEPCDIEMSLPLSAVLDMQPWTPLRAAQGSSEVLSSSGSPGSSAAGAIMPEAKRIRLRHKAAPAHNEAASPVAHHMPDYVPEDFVSRRVWQGMTDRAQYNYSYDTFRILCAGSCTVGGLTALRRATPG